MFGGLVVFLFLCLPFLQGATAPREQQSLDGTWEFRTDPNNLGRRQEWHSPGVAFPQRLQIPGIWQTQGTGEPDGVLRHNYSGPAWYRREFDIPASWQGKRIRLHIGGALRKTTVYVNGRTAGDHDGFSTAFKFDVTGLVQFGKRNTFAIRVENPSGNLRDSPDAQVSTQPAGMMNYIGSWGGVYGDVTIEAVPPTWIDQVAVTPHVTEQTASFAITIAGAQAGETSIDIAAGDYHARQRLPAPQQKVEIKLPMPNAKLWSPDTPYLYTATIRLLKDGKEIDRTQARWGMRELATRGRVLLLNGKPLYLRGYGDDNVEVLSGVMPSSKEEILRRLRLAKSFGFNAVRFHSMIPPSTYFEAADELGLLVMAELPASYTMHFLPHREYLKSEMVSALTRYHNHPSFLSLAFGNEFNLKWLKTPEERETFQTAITEFYRLAKQTDPTRIILSNDGLELRPSDMFSLYKGAPEDGPTVRHEFGEYYCSLPDPSLIEKFTGVLRPTWLEDKRRWISEQHLEQDYPAFLRNSQRLQQLGRKYQIERVRHDGNVSGYHYWLITDYPGGTGEGDSWEEGWFDYFWRPKGIAPEEGQELNSPVLLLIDAKIDDRSLWNDEPRSIPVTVSNYGEQPIEGAVIRWSLAEGHRQIASGNVKNLHFELGQVKTAGMVPLPAIGEDRAQRLELTLELLAGGKTYRNRWGLWSFPHHQLLKKPAVPVAATLDWPGLKEAYPFIKQAQPLDSADSLLVTSALSPQATAYLRRGGRVLLLADEQQFGKPGDAKFFPASGGALGSRILDHPALEAFPHGEMLDLQFFNLMQGGWNFAIDDWPTEMKPIIGGIRTTSSFLSKSKQLSRTGYLFELKVGRGKLLVSTLQIKEHYNEAHPETVFFVDCLLRYASSERFDPTFAVPDSLLDRLMVAQTPKTDPTETGAR